MAPSQRGKDSIEARRARGEISCAECRRHKLKCDRVIPCSSCVRKGCQSLCPNGMQITGHASRLGVANSEALNRKILEMGKRIRQLEDALQISHSSVSNTPHPLLAEDLLAIKSNPAQLDAPGTQENEGHRDLLDAFGTLSVTDGGTESYIGGADALLAKHFGHPSFRFGTGPGLTSSLPDPISYLSKTFPFTPINLPVEEIQAYIEERLPSYARASALVEAYLENLSWNLRPVDREQIMEELIPDIYRRKRQTTSSNTSTPDSTSSGGSSDALLPVDAHALALLLIVFACGAVADLTLPPLNEEAELYYHLARTAISLKPVFEGAGLHAVQAITLIGAYDLFSCRKVELEGSWKVVTFAMSLAASIGLNRDPSHFKLSPKLIQRRRRVFWELYSIDVWKSIGSGRPVTFTSSVIDCEFPEDTDAAAEGDGIDKPASIWRIRYRFIKEILTEVVAKLGTVHAVKYSEILTLDHKIREFCSKQILRPTGREQRIHDGTVMHLMRQVQLEMLKDLTLLMLHRNFFARALIEDSVNPMRTRFAPSFLATYRSAVSLLRLVRQQFECNMPLVMRLWPVWGHALAATIMLGAIAGCGSSSALAPQAFVEFELGVKMFTQAQMHPVVKCGMPVLLGLRDQALQALSNHGNRAESQQPSASSTDPRSETQNEREGRNAADSLGHGVSTGTGGKRRSSQEYTEFMRDTETFMKRLSSQSIPGPSSGGLGIHNEQSPGSASDTTATASPLPSHTAQDPRSVLQCGPVGYEAGSTSQMQVDNSAHASMQLPAENSGGQAGADHSFRPSSHYAYQISPSTSDLLNEFTTFSDMAVDSNIAGPSTGSSSAAGYPNMQAPAPVHPAFSLDSLVFDSPSRLSPNVVFNSDFDVSYDMRASTGDVNLLSLLPDDFDSWRAILQDSRLFGTGEGTTDSERQMNQ